MIHSRATQKATNLSLTVVTLFVITNLPYVVDEFIRYLIGWVFLNTSQGGRGEDFFLLAVTGKRSWEVMAAPGAIQFSAGLHR